MLIVIFVSRWDEMGSEGLWESFVFGDLKVVIKSLLNFSLISV